MTGVGTRDRQIVDAVGENEQRSTRPLPAWPVLAALWGYPVWWALGLMSFSLGILAVPMLALLIRRRSLVVLPGAMPWIAFTLWTLPCAVMLNGLGDVLGFAMRFSQFFYVALAIVYIANARESLSSRRILNGLVGVWITVIIGGYLGMLWPYGRLTLTVGQLLPGSILQNDYVSDLVFPQFAEVQDPWGAEDPFVRPSAPYAYTNGWGATMAILTPVVVGYAIYLGSRKSRIRLLVGLAVAIPPAVATTNRGLFLTLAICVVYVMVRMAFRRRWLPLALSFVGSSIAIFLFSQLGLLAAIAERQDTVDTTEGRGSLYAETFHRTLESPILGYGSPRPSYSSEITVGTQGMVWSAMFCFGFVGLALFLIYVLGIAMRTWRAPGPGLLWMQSALVGACIMGIYYGMDRQMLFVAVVATLLLREKYAVSSQFWHRDT